MPVLIVTPQDPFDLVLQGEQMRAAAVASSVFVDAHWPEIANDGPVNMQMLSTPLVAGNQDYNPMLVLRENQPRLRSVQGGTMIANNSVIATPCGALIDVQMGRSCTLYDFIQSTQTFTLTGITRDSTGAVLGNCDVYVFKTGDNVNVAQTISDGSGNYSIILPTNLRHFVVSYKVGSPDVTGATVNTLTAV